MSEHEPLFRQETKSIDPEAIRQAMNSSVDNELKICSMRRELANYIADNSKALNERAIESFSKHIDNVEFHDVALWQDLKGALQTLNHFTADLHARAIASERTCWQIRGFMTAPAEKIRALADAGIQQWWQTTFDTSASDSSRLTQTRRDVEAFFAEANNKIDEVRNRTTSPALNDKLQQALEHIARSQSIDENHSNN